MTLLYAVLFMGVFNCTMALVIDAKANWQSRLLFKVIPFFGGLATMAYAVKTLGWL